MRIAITIKLNSGESFQSNGMLQNLVFLARAFDSVEGWDCFFLYISDFDPDLILPKDQCLAFESYILNPPFTFDLVILGGFTTKRFNHQVFEKSKLILFHCGSTLFDDILYSISGNDRSSQLPSLVLDEIWLLPHHSRNIDYLRTLYNHSNIKVVPYVWDSLFIDLQLEQCGFSGLDDFKNLFYSRPVNQINIYEPNNTISKTCLIPLAISVAFERVCSDQLSKYNTFSAESIAKSSHFNSRCRQFGITSSSYRKKFVFHKRVPFVASLYAHGVHSLVLSHQIGCELNNLYFDALYLGLPLLHNSPLFSNYGYFYPEYCIDDAVSSISIILSSHHHSRYINDAKSQQMLNFYHPNNPKNLNCYIDTISKLFT